MRLRWWVLGALVAAATLVAIVLTDRQPVRGEYCTADVGSTHAQIDIEQARWATLMSAIAQRRGLPPRATTIAIATAFQESKIHNIDYGDRDSVGLFQQRPSQGWGTRDALMNPTYAINAFYDALVKVNGYETMVITDAAQRVQLSGFPGAYAQHEDYARALASALRGYSAAAFTCSINPTGGGLTGAVSRDLLAAFGEIPIRTSNTTIVLPLTGQRARRRRPRVGLGALRRRQCRPAADRVRELRRPALERDGLPRRLAPEPGRPAGSGGCRACSREVLRRQARDGCGDAFVGCGEGDADVAGALRAVELARCDEDASLGQPGDGVAARLVTRGPKIERALGVVDPEAGPLERLAEGGPTLSVALPLLIDVHVVVEDGGQGGLDRRRHHETEVLANCQELRDDSSVTGHERRSIAGQVRPLGG